MQIKVLGDANEKGKSFELIMKTVLGELGYTNIRCRTKPAGMELDLEAVHKTNGTRILCECKAHEKEIDPEDVKKFYGILNIEINGGLIDEGLLFSTSGFNSNVYRMYHSGGDSTKKNLTLYDTEMIIELFQQAKLLTSYNEIDRVIKNNTSYQLGERYLVIYQAAPYIVQLLKFEDEITSYIILKGSGYSVPIPIMDEISKLDNTLQTLTRLDLEIIKKVTLSLLDLKQKTADEISKEIQETIHDVNVALGDLQLQKIVIADKNKFTISLDIPTLTVLVQRLTTNSFRYEFMSSTYNEKIIDDTFADYVVGRFYLPVGENIKETLLNSARIFPSVLRFLMLSDNESYLYFYDRKQDFMARPDAQQFNDMIVSIFFRRIYEEILSDLRNAPPSYLKKKQIYGYTSIFDLKFGSQFALILRIVGNTHTSIMDTDRGQIRAGEIMSPLNISTNLGLGNNLLVIHEYNSAIKTYDIIIENSQDKELLWMAWNNKSQAFRMMGQHEHELECIENSLKIKISPEGLSNKILCLESLNRADEEINQVKKQLDDLHEDQYWMEDKLLWDLTELKSLINSGKIETDLTKIAPVAIGGDFVKFCHINFNVKSIIGTDANPDDVIKGFDVVSKDLDKVFEYLNKIYLQRLFDESDLSIYLEPLVAELLRFVYWYYKCSLIWTQTNTTSKKSETSSKITRKFLKEFDIYFQSLNYEGIKFANDIELIEWVEREKENVSPAKSKRHPDYKKILRALREAIIKITSELMMAAKCALKHDVGFDKDPSPDHDYDFVLESFGVQVKTLSDEHKKMSKEEIESFMNNLKTNGKIDNKKLDTSFFKYIREENRLQTLEEAIDQQARIIFISLSDTIIGMAMMQCAIDNKLGNTFDHSVNESIKLVQNNTTNYLPVMIVLAHTGYDYYFDGIYFKLPILRKNGKIKMDRAKIQGF